MNILLIATRDPRGQTKGRKVVLRTIIQSLGALGHEVTVAAFGSTAAAGENVEEKYLGGRIIMLKPPGPMRVMWNALRYNALRRLSLNECLYYSPHISGQINQLVEAGDVELVVADMIRTAPYAAAAGVPWFIDMDDLLSARYEGWSHRKASSSALLGYYGEEMPRLPRMAAEWIASWFLKWEASVLKRRELEVAMQADGVSLVSEPEAMELAQRSGRRVWSLPMAVDIPGGLEFRLAQRPMAMAFTGPLDYKPNLEAVSYYSAEVAPALHDRGLGGLRLNVFGKCPDDVRRNLESDQLRLHGYVDDLYGKLSGHQLFLAPLQSGSGIKTKIVEAMLLGLPVVTTPVGIQGLDLENGKQCYVWRTTDELVNVLRTIDGSPERVARVAAAGRDYAVERFTPAVLKRRWSEALDGFASPASLLPARPR